MITNLDIVEGREYQFQERLTRLAGAVLSSLLKSHPGLFPQKAEPWYKSNEDDVPK